MAIATGQQETIKAAPVTAAIIVDGISFSYNGRRAVKDISFDVQAGELFGILGPNGGGKSTTFRILATLLSPDTGRAWIHGFDVARQRRMVRRHIGVAFQSPALDIKLTVRENLLHHGHLYGLSGRDLRQRIDKALELTGLGGRAGDLVETLSGGLRRRLELVKALLPRPPVLLLDEPTVGLDPSARNEFRQMIERLRAQSNMTVLTTTHLLSEASSCNRIAILDEGHLVAMDTPAALCARIPGDVVVLTGNDLPATRKRIETELKVTLQVVNDSLRAVVADGHAFSARVASLLGDRIRSVSVARPTLADVFQECTGHAFREKQPGEESQ